MRIDNDFVQSISDFFYDKEIRVVTSEYEVDIDDGFTAIALDSTSTSFMGNLRTSNLEEIREGFGIDEKIDIAITCESDEEVSEGQVVEYEGIHYKLISVFEFDSHKLLIGKKWLLKSRTLTSA